MFAARLFPALVLIKVYHWWTHSVSFLYQSCWLWRCLPRGKWNVGSALQSSVWLPQSRGSVLPHGDWIALSFLRIVGNLFTLHSQFVVPSMNCGSYALWRGLLDCCSYFNSWHFVQRATAALCDLFNVQDVFSRSYGWLAASTLVLDCQLKQGLTINTTGELGSSV